MVKVNINGINLKCKDIIYHPIGSGQLQLVHVTVTNNRTRLPQLLNDIFNMKRIIVVVNDIRLIGKPIKMVPVKNKVFGFTMRLCND